MQNNQFEEEVDEITHSVSMNPTTNTVPVLVCVCLCPPAGPLCWSQIQEEIGRGQFGVVQLADYNGTKVALKRISNGRGRDLMEGEFNIMKCLQHPNIVQLMGFVKGRGSIGLVMEYVDNGSLEDYVNTHGPKIPVQTRHDWAMQMAQALGYLHNMGPSFYVVHRDIKPSNFMLTSSLQVKLGDFGVSRLFRKCNEVLSPILSPLLSTSSHESNWGSQGGSLDCSFSTSLPSCIPPIGHEAAAATFQYEDGYSTSPASSW